LSLAKAEVYNRIGFLSSYKGKFSKYQAKKIGIVHGSFDRLWFVIYKHPAPEAEPLCVK
jgi:hypothetical protein